MRARNTQTGPAVVRLGPMIFVLVVGCYRSHGLGDHDASVDSEVVTMCPLPEPIQSWSGRGSADGDCVMGGASGGAFYEMECDGARCTLRIDGVATCTCPPAAIDFANACPNGVPTCAAWPIFDWGGDDWSWEEEP